MRLTGLSNTPTSRQSLSPKHPTAQDPVTNGEDAIDSTTERRTGGQPPAAELTANEDSKLASQEASHSGFNDTDNKLISAEDNPQAHVELDYIPLE